MIAASGEIGIDVMVELCQSVLDGRGMPDEWALSVVVPIFKGKGDAMNCGAYRGCLLYTSPSPRDLSTSRMPSSA